MKNLIIFFFLGITLTMAAAPSGTLQGDAYLVNRKSGLVLTNEEGLAYQDSSDINSEFSQTFGIYVSSGSYSFYDSNDDTALHAPSGIAQDQLEFVTWASNNAFRWTVANSYGDYLQFENRYNGYAINVRAGSLSRAVVNQYNLISSWPRQYWALIYV